MHFFVGFGCVLQGGSGGGVKFFFGRMMLIYNDVICHGEIFLKKYFGSLENGCIFASAFDEKRLVEKVVEKESERTLKRMRR